MSSTIQGAPESRWKTPSEQTIRQRLGTLPDHIKMSREEDAVRKRLFAFLSRPDGSVEEVLAVTELGADELGYFMVGRHSLKWVARKVDVLLGMIELAELSAGSLAR